MKKRFFVILAAVMLLGVGTMLAVPAHPKALKVQQPDGTTVTLRLVGDEWSHAQTTLDGYTVMKNAKGYYVYAEKRNGQLRATSQVAHDEEARTAREQAFLADVKKYQMADMDEQTAQLRQMVRERQEETLAKHRAQGNRATDYSKFKGLIVLVEFNDKSFSRDDYQEIITDMVNKEGYEGYGKEKFTGSVRDYFSDNSGGKFQPQFDIAGPYKVDYSQYDCNVRAENSKCMEILMDAVDSADVVGKVNFKDYDGDGDGYVDLVFFILAGNGANYVGNNENLWWPHRGYIYNTKTWSWIRKDGVYLRDYASSVELQGLTSRPSSIKLDGIGTICHEFSHVLGLPDFYDTDYEESGGESVTLGNWSVMDGGCYMNDARTPVGYSLYERYSVRFCDFPPIIKSEGSYTLEPLYSSFSGYRIDTQVNNEFFLLENRQKNAFKWDAYLPASGMLVFRVDRTNNGVWTNNKVNANPEHNYYELVRANGKTASNAADDVFPGSKSVRTLNNATTPANLKSWSGKDTEWGLKDIGMLSGKVTFEVENTFVLRGLTLPETDTVGVGLKSKMKAVAEPEYAHYTLTWTTSDDKVATVDKQGYVTGVAPGKCTITVTSDNGLEAQCKVSVEEMEVVGVDEFVKKDVDTETVLKLTNAQVLFVATNGDVAYVRDSTGSIMLKDTGLGLKKNDVLNGYIYAKVGKENNMMQALGIAGKTDYDGLVKTEGEEVEPREVTLDELTEKDYSDLVVVKAVKFVKEGSVWAVSGDKRARVYNKFRIRDIKVPSDYDGHYFDVTAIWGTNVLLNEVIDELYMMASPIEVEAPTGISTVNFDEKEDGPLYNLQGQRVDSSHRGLVISKGRVVLNK
jgi:M6 family metalloprotease-like protein